MSKFPEDKMRLLRAAESKMSRDEYDVLIHVLTLAKDALDNLSVKTARVVELEQELRVVRVNNQDQMSRIQALVKRVSAKDKRRDNAAAASKRMRAQRAALRKCIQTLEDQNKKLNDKLVTFSDAAFAAPPQDGEFLVADLSTTDCCLPLTTSITESS